jgi:flagellar hook-associated protein 2
MTTIASSTNAGREAAVRTSDAKATVRAQSSPNAGIKNIEAQLGRESARLSNMGKLALALDSFRASALRLTGDGLGTAIASSGKSVSAQLVDGKAAAGTHAINVTQLAQGQQLATRALPDRDKAIGSGTPSLIEIETGSGSTMSAKTIRIGPGENTLDGVAKALRAAGLDARVTADGKGHALSLTGPGGVANTMRMSVAGDKALQDLLAYGAGASSTVTQQSPARDAQFTIDGKAYTSPTNKPDSALPGVALTLAGTGVSELSITQDAGAIAGNVKELLHSFNTLTAGLAALKNGDAANDAMLGRVQAQMMHVIDGSAQQSLAEFGITRKEGRLVLDEKKLGAAIATAPDKFERIFAKPGTGLAAQFSAKAAQQLAKGSLLADQAGIAQGQVDRLSAQREQVSAILNRQASLQAQQYALVGAGGSSLFGTSGAAPSSLFDMLG